MIAWWKLDLAKKLVMLEPHLLMILFIMLQIRGAAVLFKMCYMLEVIFSHCELESPRPWELQHLFSERTRQVDKLFNFGCVKEHLLNFKFKE